MERLSEMMHYSPLTLTSTPENVFTYNRARNLDSGFSLTPKIQSISGSRLEAQWNSYKSSRRHMESSSNRALSSTPLRSDQIEPSSSQREYRFLMVRQLEQKISEKDAAIVRLEQANVELRNKLQRKRNPDKENFGVYGQSKVFDENRTLRKINQDLNLQVDKLKEQIAEDRNLIEQLEYSLSENILGLNESRMPDIHVQDEGFISDSLRVNSDNFFIDTFSEKVIRSPSKVPSFILSESNCKRDVETMTREEVKDSERKTGYSIISEKYEAKIKRLKEQFEKKMSIDTLTQKTQTASERTMEVESQNFVSLRPKHLNKFIRINKEIQCSSEDLSDSDKLEELEAENSALKISIQMKEEAISHLKTQFQKLKTVSDSSVQIHYEQLKEEVKRRESMFQQAKSSESLLQEELKNLSNKLNDHIANRLLQSGQFEKETRELLTKHDLLKDKYRSLKTESNLLRQKLHLAEDSLEPKHKDYFEIAADYERRISDVQKKEKILIKENAALKNDINELKKKISESEINRKDAKALNDKLQNELKLNNLAVSNLKIELENRAIPTDVQMDNLKKELNDLTQSCLKLETAYSDMYDKHAAQVKANGQLAEELQQTKQRMTVLVEASEERIQSLTAENNKIKALVQNS